MVTVTSNRPGRPVSKPTYAPGSVPRGGGTPTARQGRPLPPGQSPIVPTRTTSGQPVTINNGYITAGGRISGGGGAFSQQQGNYQTMSGEVQQVDYNIKPSSQQSSARFISGTKVPETGITKALAAGGAFGAVGGASTPEGTAYQYPVFGTGVKQVSTSDTIRSTSFRQFFGGEKQRLKEAYSIDPEDRAAVDKSSYTVITSPVRVAGFALAKGSQSLEPYALPGRPGKFQKGFLSIIESQGVTAYEKPGTTAVVTAVSGGFGRGLGIAGGKAVTYFGAKNPVVTSRVVSIAEGVGGLTLGGVGAYQAYKDPVGFGANLAPMVAFGGGLVGGYRTTNPLPKITTSFGKVTSLKGRSYGEFGDFYTLSGSGRARVSVTQYGKTTVRYPKYSVDLEAQPGGFAFGEPLSVKATARVARTRINDMTFGGVSESFVGRLQTPSPPSFESPSGRVGVLALRSKSYPSRVLQTEFYPSSMIEKSNPYKSFTGTLAFRSREFSVSGRGASSSLLSEGSSLLEFSPLPRRQRFFSGDVRSFGGVPSRVSESGLRSSPFDIGFLSGRSLRVGKEPSSIAFPDPVVASRGFGLLRRGGLYRDSLRTRIGRGVDYSRSSLSEGFFPRRNKRLYSGLMFERPSPGQSSVFEPPVRGSSRVAPPLGGIMPLFGARSTQLSGIGFSSIGLLGGTGGVGLSSSRGLVGVSPSRVSDPIVSYRGVTGFGSGESVSSLPAYRTVTSSAFDSPFNTGSTVLAGASTPPVVPPFVGLHGLGITPLFGADRSRGVEGRGRGRSFKYAPSFNAFLFGIRGKRPTGPLSGFETRPIITRRAR